MLPSCALSPLRTIRDATHRHGSRRLHLPPLGHDGAALSSWPRQTSTRGRFSTRRTMPSPASSTPRSKFCSPRTGEKLPPPHAVDLRLTFALACRVFLTGKVHVEYRKVLNTLFTRKALGYVSKLLVHRSLPFAPASALSYVCFRPWRMWVLVGDGSVAEADTAVIWKTTASVLNVVHVR